MARILAYTSPARGHLFPVAAILSQLSERGHDISVRTLSAEVPGLQAKGFNAAAIDPRVEGIPLDDWRTSNIQKALAASVAAFCARAEFDAADLSRAIEQDEPDVLLVDINSWGAMAAAEKWGGPWSAFCPYPLALRSNEVPPFGPGLTPASGVLGRLRDSVARPLVTGVVARKMLPGLNSVRAELDLKPLHQVDELFLKPPLLVYMTSEPFEYHRSQWPTNVVMVGPCEEPSAAEVPRWLAQIDMPIVLVTTSSEFQDDGRLARVALEALANESVHVIATVPSGDPAAFRVPANAHVVKFLPHALVLDRAVCAVTHGGMGATQKALAHGVPVCAVPFGRDQLEVARRVEVAGAGTRLSAKRLSPERLRAKVLEAMNMTPGASRVAAGYAAAGGASAAADAIESRLLGVPAKTA